MPRKLSAAKKSQKAFSRPQTSKSSVTRVFQSSVSYTPSVTKFSVSPVKTKVKKTPLKAGPSYLKGTKSSQTKGLAATSKLKESPPPKKFLGSRRKNTSEAIKL